MKVILTLSFVLMLGCSLQEREKNNENEVDNTRYIQALAWYQTSGERDALSYQAFNLAKFQLSKELKNKKVGKRLPAIILDIDETVLDNSPYQAEAIKGNFTYPTGWKEWIRMAKGKPLPGSVDFLKWVNSKDVEIFYVSNRKVANLDATYKNLKEFDIPVKKENIFLRTKESSKQNRRDFIRKKYNILLLVGDNLADFSVVFEGQDKRHRNNLVKKMKNEFGNHFIVLPNPIYGDWEGALDERYYKKSMPEREEILKRSLRYY